MVAPIFHVPCIAILAQLHPQMKLFSSDDTCKTKITGHVKQMLLLILTTLDEIKFLIKTHLISFKSSVCAYPSSHESVAFVPKG